MILYEYEGKQLLFQAGVDVPVSQLLDSPDQEVVIKTPLVLKAQVLSGKRADVGGIVLVDPSASSGQVRGKDFATELKDLFSETINGEKVEKVLVEEKVQYEKEYYLSISYDTDYRAPILTFSAEGGTGVEERNTKVFPINPLEGNVSLDEIKDDDFDLPYGLIEKLTGLFFEADMTLLEINPLVKTVDGRWVALDAKVKLDDDAKKRHPSLRSGQVSSDSAEQGWDYPPRSAPGHTPTEREIAAKKIDEGDYRGTAGAAYFDLPGDIAILSSGGGVSLTALDALTKAGGKPSNFTEYSGNPPKEKVVKLTKIVLDKPDIHGLWVIGTVAANFTDIYETLSGFIEGLREASTELDKHFNFPIVIRRGGPRDKEAFEMLKEVKDFNLVLQGEETSISQSAKIMADLAREYAEKQS
jgi:citryl-CoA synthetase large subunit